MPLYEHVFIARQDISSAQVDGLTESFSAIVDKLGGKVEKTEYWGLRTLAYRIKKNRKGHYVLFNLDAPAEAVLELERNLRLNEDILRYLTIRVEELEEGPSAIMRSRADRDDHPRERKFNRDDDRGAAPKAKPAPVEAAPAKAAPAEAAAPSESASEEKTEATGD